MDDPTAKTEIETFLGGGDLWYWHIKAGNGEIVAAGKCGEENEVALRAQVDLLAHHLGAGTPARFYGDGDDGDGDWRWAIDYDDGVIGKASEGYKARQSCEANLDQVRELFAAGYVLQPPDGES